MQPDSTPFPLAPPFDDASDLPDPRSGWSHASRVMLVLLLVVCVASMALQVSGWLDGAPSLARVSLYNDQSGNADIAGIASLPSATFTPVDPQVSLGFSPAVRWFRVEAVPEAHGMHVLSVQPSYLDDVRIYLRDPAKVTGWRLYQQGDRFPVSQRPRTDLDFAVDHDFQPGEVAYVRVKTLNAHNIRVRLLPMRDADRENTSTLVAVGLYCGMVLVLAGASALAALVNRDRYWAANALFQLCTLFTMAFSFGLGSRFLLPDHPGAADQLLMWLGFLQFFFGALFYRLFFAQFGVPRWLLHLQSGFLLLLPAQILLVVAGQLEVALRMGTLILPLAIVVCALGVHQLRCDDAFLLALLRLNILSVGLFFLATFATHQGWLTPHLLHLYPGVTLNLLTAVMLHFVLLRRGELLTLAQQSALRELALARQQIVLERRQRHEDGRFLGMLLHELRSPMAVISVSLGAIERKLRAVSAERDLHRIAQSVGQMNDVLQQVQAVTELEGRQDPDTVQTPVQESTVCGELQETLRQRWAGEARLQGDWNPAANAGHAQRRLPGSASLIEMMVRNLLDNALKYSPPESLVHFRCQWLEGATKGIERLVIVVENEVGPAGAPDPDQLFKKYYRAPIAHQYSGSGLGLYWVRGVARSLGGDVRLVRDPSRVCFEIHLPLLPA